MMLGMQVAIAPKSDALKYHFKYPVVEMLCTIVSCSKPKSVGKAKIPGEAYLQVNSYEHDQKMHQIACRAFSTRPYIQAHDQRTRVQHDQNASFAPLGRYPYEGACTNKDSSLNFDNDPDQTTLPMRYTKEQGCALRNQEHLKALTPQRRTGCVTAVHQRAKYKHNEADQ
jgi:hypothetical protein